MTPSPPPIRSVTAGGYLTEQRLAAGLTVEDVALRVDTVPAISHRSRAEWLGMIEADLTPIRLSTAVALYAIPELRIDLVEFARRIDGAEPGWLVRFIPVHAPADAA